MDRYLYEEHRLRMSRRARGLGVASVICLFILFSMPVVASIVGAFAILFAILSKGYNEKMDKDASFAVKLGIASILIGITITAYAFSRLYFDPEYRKEALSYVDAIYGSEYEAQYGATPSELIESFLGGFENGK